MYTWIRIEIGWQIFNSQIIIYIAQYYKMVLIFNIIRVGTYQTFKKERMHSQPHLVASSGGREKITHLGAKQTKQSVTT